MVESYVKMNRKDYVTIVNKLNELDNDLKNYKIRVLEDSNKELLCLDIEKTNRIIGVIQNILAE